MSGEALLAWLHELGVDFGAPELLWALLLTPGLLMAFAGARRARRRVAGAFQITGPGRRRSRGAGPLVRLVTLLLLLLGLAGLVVGFARPQVALDTPDDRATVVIVVDASTTMRATDVRPTRFEMARSAARAAVGAMPGRLQVAVVGYSRTAYILLAPTHDHGAAPVAIGRLRTTEGAAAGDAIAVALATLPLRDEGTATAAGAAGNAGAVPAPGAPGAPGSERAARVPGAIVWISSGENTTGRRLEEAVAAAREAGVPVHIIGIGPRAGAEQRAPFEEDTLRQVARVTGGRYFTAPSGTDWKGLYRDLGSAVSVERRSQEIGHYVGAGALVVTAMSMTISLLATRRLV